MRRIRLLSTGGTIEKTYDERTGVLENRFSIVGRMLQELRLEETEIVARVLMSKDSLEITDDERIAIVRAVAEELEVTPPWSGIVILHGTDTLTVTGRQLAEELPAPAIPVVLTGAMRPFEMKHADALQNLTEALFAAGVLAPGVYCVAHGRALRFPAVRKDRDRGTFVAEEPPPETPER